MADETPGTESAPSLHDVVEAAYEHVDKYEKGELIPEPAEPATPEEELSDEERDRQALARADRGDGRDASGKFVGKEPPVSGKPPTEAPRPQAQPGVVPPPPTPAAPAAFKAPQSWRPVERDALSKADPVVQAAVQRREREIAQWQQTAAPQRRFIEQWQQTVTPHEQMIRAAGQTPLGAINNMLNIASALATRPEPDRARIIAGLMSSYGVTPQMLGHVLTTGGPQPTAQPQQQHIQDPRLDQMWQEWTEMRTTQESQEAAAEDAALEQFAATHPFLDELTDMMSDAMAVAAQRNVAMDYEEAYQRALMLRPDLMQVEMARGQGSQEPTPDPATAGLSVSGTPHVRVRPGKTGMTSREAAEAAWDIHAGSGNPRV